MNEEVENKAAGIDNWTANMVQAFIAKCTQKVKEIDKLAADLNMIRVEAKFKNIRSQFKLGKAMGKTLRMHMQTIKAIQKFNATLSKMGAADRAKKAEAASTESKIVKAVLEEYGVEGVTSIIRNLVK